MTIELYRVIQPVQDIETAARFYAHVLGAQGERVSPGRHYFSCGSTILACYDPVADGDGIGQGWRHHSTYAKGNFQFERVVTGWRATPVLDLRLKK